MLLELLWVEKGEDQFLTLYVVEDQPHAFLLAVVHSLYSNSKFRDQQRRKVRNIAESVCNSPLFPFLVLRRTQERLGSIGAGGGGEVQRVHKCTHSLSLSRCGNNSR